jgi:hypothetical protein
MAYNAPQTPTLLPIVQVAIPASVTTVYTTPSKARTIIQNIDIVNTTGSSATFDIYFVPQGGTAGASNAFYYQNTLASKTHLQWVGNQVLDSLSTLQVNASITGVTVTISGTTYVYY